MNKKSKIDFISLVMLVVGLATVFFQIFPPKTVADQAKSLLYF